MAASKYNPLLANLAYFCTQNQNILKLFFVKTLVFCYHIIEICVRRVRIKEVRKVNVNCSGAGENWRDAWPEGEGVHNGGQAQDGHQAVQLTHGHVQRGHHRGNHDSGILIRTWVF